MSDFRVIRPSTTTGTPVPAIRVHVQGATDIRDRDIPVDSIRMIENAPPRKEGFQCRIWIHGVAETVNVVETRDQVLALIQATQRPWFVTENQG